MVPGIDFAGQVKESRDPRFVPGQAVILTGWGVGENHWGGLATEACVKGDWLVALPETLQRAPGNDHRHPLKRRTKRRTT